MIERVYVFGAGKVGRALAKAAREAGAEVTLRAQRRGLPKRPIEADLLILALRDRDLAPTAEQIVAAKLLEPPADAGRKRRRHVTAVVHCAGALGPEVLGSLRGPSVSVAKMHPMISFASLEFTPSLRRGQLHVDGDPEAVKRARKLGKMLGMTPREIDGLDHVAYHAAAGLVANGAAALAAAGIAVLGKAGVDAPTAAAMMGPLLRSVADNVERLGMPAALTGPVRRGDAAGIARHLQTLLTLEPAVVPLYKAAGLVQVPLARQLAEGTPEGLDEIEATLGAR